MRTLLWSALVGLLWSVPVRAEDWPQWRGPRLDGSSTEKNLPTSWSPTENIVWKTPIPGIGHSSPIVVGDRVFITSALITNKTGKGDAKEPERVLLCVDRKNGKILWEREVFKSILENKHGLNSFASSTPASDGKHVWVTFLRSRPFTKNDPQVPIRDKIKLWDEVIPEMVLACYTVEGTKVYEKVPGRFYSRHGFCTPPILYKDLVILNGDQDAQAYIVALNKNTGEEVWRVDRPNRTRSYCAPLIVDAGGKTQMVLSGSLGITSYNPDNGNLIWSVKGPTEQYVASPVFGDGLLFLTAGFPTYHNLAIRPDGQGDVTKTHVAWHESKTAPQKASYVPSPLAVDKYFYMISDRGGLSCFEAKTGNRLWMENLGNHHSASPVLADGHVYLSDDDGITYVLKANGKFDLVAKNDLKEECYASPAISQGQIFLRTGKHLWCIGRN